MGFYKLSILGEAAVGKTALIGRLTTNKFARNYTLTVGTDVKTYTFKEVRYSLWDLGGQVKFDMMRGTFLRGSKIVFIVFDLSRPNIGRERIPYYKQVIEKNASPETIFILYNKSDLLGKKQDVKGEIETTQQLLKKHFGKEFTHFVVSAKKGEGVLDPFESLSTMFQ
ncbi:MAG: putative Small GTP-binding protein [Promethearchaeota archaeon]|nr:MAG: putative Small GTP-binding protein [Candidatus Lokiarchaeota archaeon]